MQDVKVYNSLSKQYNDLYLHNILSFQQNVIAQGLARDYYVDFYPSFGTAPHEKADFLIYGQAINGWSSGFEPDKSMTSENVHESIAASNTYFEPLHHNPLDWVNVQWDNASYYAQVQEHAAIGEFYPHTYRAHRSFFWNVTYKLINDFYGMERSDPHWTSKMVWSNLYKIAPENANPNEYEQKAQREISIKLVQQEIAEIKPSYCIVLTNGKWWEPFGEALIKDFPSQHALPSRIHYKEEIGDTKIIVTERPRFGGDALQDLFVRQILDLL